MSKWFSTRLSALAISALTLIISFLFPISSQAAQASLTWDPNDPAPDGYCIYQRAEGQAYDYSQPCWTGTGTTGTVDGLEENTTYYFVVRAFVAVEESANSNEVKFVNGASSPIWIEAEDGDLQWPMEIGDDAAASAGGYVWVPSGNNGYAEYHFEVPEAGDYVIWGREISNDSTSNSFYVSVDGQADMVWHTKLSGQNVWTWDVVSNPTDGDPQLYWLEAGFHTLTIKQREEGTKLDTIVIANDLGLTISELDSIICPGTATCTMTANPDMNNDGSVDLIDFSMFGAVYGTTDPRADFNGDGNVDLIDFSIFGSVYGQ